MPVTRCICHQINFSEVKKISEERGLSTVQELQVEKICSTNCKLCVPYIKKLLKTGRTAFQPVLKTE